MAQAKKSEQQTKRILKGQEEIHHDLFRLENSITKKNISFNARSPIWEPIEHKHFYHNIDSDGKPQDKCSPTAGHFHFVKVVEKDGNLVAECSAPYRMERGKAVEYVNDNHTHDVTYLESELITRRVMNADALAEINRQQNAHMQRMQNPTV